jgi:predicted outer membrane repeat protein
MLAAKSVVTGTLVLLMIGLASAAPAATRLVDGATGADSGDCTISACATIAYAVDQATGGDTIDIADSIYTEMLTVDKSLIFQGESEDGTIIQADPDPFVVTGRVLTSSGDLDLTLADLTIRHGNGAWGAGLQMNGLGDLTLTRVTFYRNSAGGGRGGGVRFATVGCNIAMSEVSFVENQAGHGGGFDILDCDLVTLDDVDFIGNSGGTCGGGGTMTRIPSAELTNARFFGNTVGTSGGAGICVLNSLIEADSVEFRGNFSDTSGGAIYSHNSTWTITNALFSGNRAENGSSAIYNVTSGSITHLVNVTIVGNRTNSAVGAIIHIAPGTKIHNTIFWNNQNVDGIGSAQASIWNLMDGADVQNSLIQGFTAGELGGSGNFDGSINPRFMSTTSPAAAPTTSGDLHLREFSPVKDAGNNALIAGFDFDLDGVARIFNGTVDLGPYEFGSGILFRDRFEQGGSL